MNKSMDFYSASTDHIERKVGFDDKNAVSILRKFFMFWNPAEMRVHCERADSFVELFREGSGSCGASAGNPIIDREQVFFGNRKVADRILIWHGCAAAVFASSVNG